MKQNKNYRDAITGHFIKKEEASQHPDTTVAETRTTTKKPRKPRKPKVKDEETAIIPESGIVDETPQQRAFRMKQDVVFKGEIYLCKHGEKLPEESQEYLMNKSDEWSE